MVLSLTSGFIFIFLAISLTVYWLFRRWIKVQNLILLAISYTFYGFFDWTPLIFILTFTLFNYLTGIYLEKLKNQYKKILERFTVIGNLVAMGFLKYFDFFSPQISSLLSLLGIPLDPFIINFIVPLGLSYYTLQVIAYNIEVYRGKIRATRDFVEFAVFVAYFPKLTVGPIEAPDKFLGQISQKRQMHWEDVSGAVQLMILGYFKKIVIADFIANYLNTFYATPLNYTSIDALLVIVIYPLQIYADFSGYTDIVRGMSKMFGIQLMENFREPFLAQNPRDFWSRWHISLTTWLRNYIYIPLGGNKKGKSRQFFNTTVTFVLCLMWHDIVVNMLIYALLQSFYVITHQIIIAFSKQRQYDLNLKPKNVQRRLHILFCFISYQLQVFTFVFFRTSSPQAAWTIIDLILTPKLSDATLYFTGQLIVASISVVFLTYFLDKRQDHLKTHEIFSDLNWFKRGLIFTIMIMAIIGFRVGTYSTFIYQGF